MPIDFSRLSGEEFEFFCRDLLESLGVQILDGPARGPDRKKDLIIQYKIKDVIGREVQYKFLVQCKNNAKSKKSVYETDLGDIRSACIIHNTTGYLLITTTIPSDSVQNILKAINEEGKYMTHYWDKIELEKLISKNTERIKILERYGLIDNTYQYIDLVPDEYELLGKINKILGIPLKTTGEFGDMNESRNSCYVKNGHILNLHIENNIIGDYLEELNTFKELSLLNLNNMKISSFPKSFRYLKNLSDLYLYCNNITDIPKEINEMENLSTFFIYGNPLKRVKISVELLKRIEFIFIDEKQIPVFKKLFITAKSTGYLFENLKVKGFTDEENENLLKRYKIY